MGSQAISASSYEQIHESSDHACTTYWSFAWWNLIAGRRPVVRCIDDSSTVYTLYDIVNDSLYDWCLDSTIYISIWWSALHDAFSVYSEGRTTTTCHARSVLCKWILTRKSKAILKNDQLGLEAVNRKIQIEVESSVHIVEVYGLKV